MRYFHLCTGRAGTIASKTTQKERKKESDLQHQSSFAVLCPCARAQSSWLSPATIATREDDCHPEEYTYEEKSQ